ncbi:MAG TPA: MFS transporter [Candidatus Binataceae bacterium]|nr:MFS transporter [Candidatus Binataceae bacterium]
MNQPETIVTAAETARDEERFSVRLGFFGRSPEFTRRQWRVFLISITAGFFDQYDRALFSLALKQIQQGLKIAESRLGVLSSLIRFGYLLSFLITPLADVFGRKRLLVYTIFGYTIFTGLSALAPNQFTFVSFQVLARGFAGAEATVALVILVEEVDAGVRGWTIGLLAALSAVGYGTAAIAFGAINVVPYGWRGLYALALIPLVIIIPLRRSLPESHRFIETSHTATHPTNVFQPMAALLRAYPGRLVMLLITTFLANMGGNAAGFLFPKYLQEAHGYTPGNVRNLFFLAGAVGIMGSIIVGRLSDRFGRRRMGALCLLLAPLMTIWIYNTSGNSVIPAWVLELFFDTAASTIFNAYGAELFPTSHRSTAGSALVVAGTTGGAVGLLLESLLYTYTHSHWTAVSYLTVFWLIAPFIMYFGFPETAGQELEAISPEDPAAREAVD